MSINPSPLRDLLRTLYGPDIEVRYTDGRPKLVVDQAVELNSRERALLEWMLEQDMQLDENLTSEDFNRGIEQPFREAWSFLYHNWQGHLNLVGQADIPNDLKLQLTEVFANWDFPAVAICIEIQDTIPTDRIDEDWIEWLAELANAAEGRSVLVPISKRQIGAIMSLQPDSFPPFRQRHNEQNDEYDPPFSVHMMDLVIEECKTWVDALKQELNLDVRMYLSSLVVNENQILSSMLDALRARDV